jgi:hypothetical protein
METSLLTPDYRDFDRWALLAACDAAGLNHRAVRKAQERMQIDRWALGLSKMLPAPKCTRQYFDGTIADSTIVPITTTPTTTKTSLFSPTQANQYLPVPFGANAPFAGQVFYFAFGGLITTPATGTLIIDPYHGPGSSTTVFGTDMGASAAQTVTASLSNSPFMLHGFLAYRSISAASTSSTAWLSGSFNGQGTLATAGAGWTITFGSTAAVSVDTSGLAANLFGALNFAVTFSVTAGSITVEWTNIRALN